MDNNKKVDPISILAGISALGLIGSINKDKLLGRESLYHSTDNNFIKDIKKEGILSAKSTDNNNITNTALKDIPKEEKEGKVYLAKRKSVADHVGRKRDSMHLLNHSGKSKTLAVNIPYEDYKKLKIVDNPELLGSNTEEEFVEKRYKKKLGKLSQDDRERLSTREKRKLKRLLRKQYRGLKEDTVVIQGDIPSKYIKGSDDYEKGSIKDFKEYVKKNPKRFGKEAGKIIGGSILGLGAAVLSNLKKHSN